MSHVAYFIVFFINAFSQWSAEPAEFDLVFRQTSFGVQGTTSEVKTGSFAPAGHNRRFVGRPVHTSEEMFGGQEIIHETKLKEREKHDHKELHFGPMSQDGGPRLATVSREEDTGFRRLNKTASLPRYRYPPPTDHTSALWTIRRPHTAPLLRVSPCSPTIASSNGGRPHPIRLQMESLPASAAWTSSRPHPAPLRMESSLRVSGCPPVSLPPVVHLAPLPPGHHNPASQRQSNIADAHQAHLARAREACRAGRRGYFPKY